MHHGFHAGEHGAQIQRLQPIECGLELRRRREGEDAEREVEGREGADGLGWD